MIRDLGRGLVSLSFAAALILASLSIAGACPNSQAANMAQLLDQSGYKFTKAGDNVWTIPFKGKSLTDIQLIITTVEGIVVIGAIVAKKETIKATPDMMRAVLKLPHNLDRVKIGLDDDEDLFVRVEVSARVFDGVELKANVEQVAAAADQVHAAIKQFLVAPK